MLDHDILTIEEVARYLRVSERTIYDWAHRGTIPCGKIGTTWRFRRTEIEAWVDSRLGPRASSGQTEFTGLAGALVPERILLTHASNKAEVLETLLDCLAQSDAVTDPAELRREMLKRERIMSTGMGHGLGVPHVRLPSVRKLVMAMAVNDRDIAGYDALDDSPVRVVCMMAARDDQHTQYLRALAAVSAVLRDPGRNKAILAAPDGAAVRAILLGASSDEAASTT